MMRRISPTRGFDGDLHRLRQQPAGVPGRQPFALPIKTQAEPRHLRQQQHAARRRLRAAQIQVTEALQPPAGGDRPPAPAWHAAAGPADSTSRFGSATAENPRLPLRRLQHREFRRRRPAFITDRRTHLRMSKIALDDRQRPLQLGQLRRFALGNFVVFSTP